MRPPKDPSDFSSHVTRKNGAIWIYCVECERWTKVIVMAQATAIYQQNHWPNKTEDARQPGFHCGVRGCWADVGYLLKKAEKDRILEMAAVPISRKKSIAAGSERKPHRVQLRMQI